MTDNIKAVQDLDCYQEYLEKNRDTFVQLARATKEEICASQAEAKQYIDTLISEVKTEVKGLEGIENLTEQVGRFQKMLDTIDPDGNGQIDLLESISKQLNELKKENEDLLKLVDDNFNEIKRTNQDLALLKTETAQNFENLKKEVEDNDGELGVVSGQITSLQNQIQNLEGIKAEAAKKLVDEASCNLLHAIVADKEQSVASYRDEMKKINCGVFNTSAPAEDPETDAPPAEDPETDAPPAEDPVTDAPPAEDPGTDAPPAEDPGTDAPPAA